MSDKLEQLKPITVQEISDLIDKFVYFEDNLEPVLVEEKPKLPPLDEKGYPISKEDKDAYNQEATIVTLLKIAEEYKGLKFVKDKKAFIARVCNRDNAGRGLYVPKATLLNYVKIYNELYETV